MFRIVVEHDKENWSDKRMNLYNSYHNELTYGVNELTL